MCTGVKYKRLNSNTTVVADRFPADESFSGVLLLRCVTDSQYLSRMANALHRSQTRLWRTRNQSLLTAVIGTRWMSNFKSHSSLSDIEVPSIFSPHVVLISVPEHSMEG